MNLDVWQGVVLGLVQGLTEFLPISSSGHLVLAERFVGFQPAGLFFEIVVHLATLLSVLVAYRSRIAELAVGVLRGRPEAWRYLGLLVVASVPAALAGAFFRDYFERTFHSLVALGWQFLFTAALLWSARWAIRRAAPPAPITWGRSLIIGFGQALAIVPAISRSGATIVPALWTGVSPIAAAEFSFLMSIIVIGGSGVMELGNIPPGVDPFAPGLIAAFLAALISGIVAIRFLVALLRSSRFHLFAPYCAAVGVFCLVWFGWLGR
ncbi:MAG: undecaprenyl-diphosphate phosphatase [Gemmatimonadetes bacterium]|nr:undecaprenyl-diphosphate phosphatase [Gemmatimonadota bacterium]